MPMTRSVMFSSERSVPKKLLDEGSCVGCQAFAMTLLSPAQRRNFNRLDIDSKSVLTPTDHSSLYDVGNVGQM